MGRRRKGDAVSGWICLDKPYDLTSTSAVSRVRRLFNERTTQKLTVQGLETLAVIAYRQPITAAEITEVRGVNTSGVLNTLLERHLIKIVGRKQVVGRPFMYATTKEFLIRFGLNDLTDLPKVEDMAEALGRCLEVQRHISATGLEHCQQGHGQVQRTIQGHAHQAIGANALATQVMGQAIGALVQLAIAQAFLALHHGQRLGRLGLDQRMHGVALRIIDGSGVEALHHLAQSLVIQHRQMIESLARRPFQRLQQLA